MATITSNASGAWATGATWVGGSAPADGDAVVIAAGHSILMDADLSAYTGLQTVTITSHATTPGMLYFADGTSGYLKLRTGYNLVGTNAAAKGRLLANSNGTWGTTTALANTNKAVIDLQGTSKIDATYLDIALYCTQPSNLYVEVYKTAYTCTTQATDVNASTDVITFTSAPPASGTAVKVRSSGTLPGGLTTLDIYYTRTVSGNTCKLALQNSDATIVDITSTGSGTLTMYDGHTDTGTATVNVIQDVTGDTCWTTTDGHNRVVLVDIAPASYDQQRAQLTTINAASLVLSANVDSTQYPLARVYLASRNVSIRTAMTVTSQVFIDYNFATASAGVFQCELVSTAGTGTTFYGRAISNGTGHTVSGTMSGFYAGLYGTQRSTMSGVILACSDPISYGINNTVSGTIAGCQYAVIYGLGHVVSGDIVGVSSCLLYSVSCALTGTMLGGDSMFNRSTGLAFCDVHSISFGFYHARGFAGAGSYTGVTNFLQGSSVTLSSATFAGVGAYQAAGETLADFCVNRSFNHNGVANDTRAWSAGGSMAHETSEVPSGKTYSHKFTHTSASYWTVMEWEIDRTEPLTTTFVVHAKHDATSLAEAARLHWQIIDPADDPLLGGTALAEWIATDSTDWRSSTITYTRTDDRPLLVRVCAQRGSGNSYAYIEPLSGSSPRVGDRTGGLR